MELSELSASDELRVLASCCWLKWLTLSRDSNPQLPDLEARTPMLIEQFAKKQKFDLNEGMGENYETV